MNTRLCRASWSNTVDLPRGLPMTNLHYLHRQLLLTTSKNLGTFSLTYEDQIKSSNAVITRSIVFVDSNRYPKAILGFWWQSDSATSLLIRVYLIYDAIEQYRFLEPIFSKEFFKDFFQRGRGVFQRFLSPYLKDFLKRFFGRYFRTTTKLRRNRLST